MKSHLPASNKRCGAKPSSQFQRPTLLLIVRAGWWLGLPGPPELREQALPELRARGLPGPQVSPGPQAQQARGLPGPQVPQVPPGPQAQQAQGLPVQQVRALPGFPAAWPIPVFYSQSTIQR